MKLIEQRIIHELKNLSLSDFEIHRLSSRDSVFRLASNIVSYELHDTKVFDFVYKRYTNIPIEVIIRTDGWLTNTTKSRINAILEGFNIPFKVNQKDFVWYWQDGVSVRRETVLKLNADKEWQRVYK